jgi:NADH:ubiquinone oxidoreductase subunit F (NADH-binding)
MRLKAIGGIFICAKSVGAEKGYIYLRYQYRNLISTIRDEIAKFKESCAEYANINVEVRIGAGTYIAGEETALFESIQGNAPIPRRNRPWFVYH